MIVNDHRPRETLSVYHIVTRYSYEHSCDLYDHWSFSHLIYGLFFFLMACLVLPKTIHNMAASWRPWSIFRICPSRLWNISPQVHSVHWLQGGTPWRNYVTMEHMENHHVEWGSSVFLWPCPMAVIVYQRVPDWKAWRKT